MWGVGRRGRTETYIECQPWLLSDEQLHYLWLLYSAEALASDGSLYELLEGSSRFAGDLAKRLRERIYERCCPHSGSRNRTGTRGSQIQILTNSPLHTKWP